MRFLLPLVSAVLPIAIAPGSFLFYFDVTPKLLILLIGAAVALVLWRGELPVEDAPQEENSKGPGEARRDQHPGHGRPSRLGFGQSIRTLAGPHKAGRGRRPG